MKSKPHAILARGFIPQGFDHATEELKIEFQLKPAPIEKLRSLFDVGDDLEMYDAYPLDAAKACAPTPLVSEPVDTEEVRLLPAALRVADIGSATPS